MEFTQILNSLGSLFSPSPLIKKASIPQTIMILSPHPDDECIMSSLALRLQLENNAHIVNVAVTLGSKVERQEERRQELLNACELLEMECLFLEEDWPKKTTELKSLIQKYQPSLIIAPHVKDHHPTHIKTGELAKEAIESLKYSCVIAWSEFWGPLKNPNFLVEVPTEIVELQMRALALHVGEVARNPYHLRLPAWMMDNVRRGAELIGGKGADAPSMPFGILYQIQVSKSGKLANIHHADQIFTSKTDIGQIFKFIFDAADGSRTRVK